MEAIVTKLEFLKNEAGESIYDEAAIARFHAKAVKSMERQNAKIAANPSKYKGYSICDAKAFVDLQVSIYKHNFRQYKEIPVR